MQRNLGRGMQRCLGSEVKSVCVCVPRGLLVLRGELHVGGIQFWTQGH